MSEPGWYPDPAGAPGQFRYWDGQAWSTSTTADPKGTAPGAGSDRAGSSALGGRPRRRNGLLIALAAILVLALAAAAAIGVIRSRDVADPDPFPPPASTVIPSDPGVAPTPVPSSSPTASPTPAPTGRPFTPQPVSCPVGNPTVRQPHPSDGRIHGGGLSFAEQRGYRTVPGNTQMSWAYDVGSQDKIIEEQWSSMIAVGALGTFDGFEEPRGAAELAMACTAPSPIYAGFTSRTDIRSEPVTVDGKPGWVLRSEIRVDGTRTKVTGDTVEIIVVDTGSPESLSMFWGCVPLGDSAGLSRLEAVVAGLRAE